MSKEIKVGLLAVVALVALFIGFNFLRGSNVLSNNKTYYVTYPNVEGLNAGSAVFLNGIKVGQVKSLDLQPVKGNVVRVGLELDKNVVVGDSTIASLGGSLLGAKSITLTLGRNRTEYTGGEELKAASDASITDAFQKKALPVLEAADSTLTRLNTLINRDAQTSIQGTLVGARKSTEALQKLIESNQRNINQITSNLAQMSRALNTTTRKLDRIAVNFSELSDSLKRAPVGSAVRRLDSTLASAQTTVASLNRSLSDRKGSLGRFINDTALYNNLTVTTASANELMVDLKNNPKRYVHFSVFGGGKAKTKSEVTRKPDGSVTTEVKQVKQ